MAKEFTHNPDCIQATKNYKDALEKYSTENPNYCKSCMGWGGAYSHYDPSPAGVSLGSGYMVDYDPCPDCVDKGICPRCGKLSPNMVKEIEEGYCDELVCEHCGWKEGETDGVPQAPECFCWYEEEIEFWDSMERDNPKAWNPVSCLCSSKSKLEESLC